MANQKPKYEVGDLVIPIRQKPGRFYMHPFTGEMNFYYHPMMIEQAGEVCKVMEISEFDHGCLYRLNAKGNNVWNWLENWLVPALNHVDNATAYNLLHQGG